MNPDKLVRDQVVGKAAEWLVYECLVPAYPDLSKPDMKHYKPREKTWAHDLSTSNFTISVKGQDVNQAKVYGDSWVFERTDKWLLETYPGFAVFVSVDVDSKAGEIRAILKRENIVQGNMKLPKHRDKKFAVYLDQQGTDLWQLEAI